MKIFGMQVGAKSVVELAIDEALALIGEKNYGEAIAVIENKALSREPENRRVLLHLGLCHMLKGDFDKADATLRPLTEVKGMDSEKAAAQIALEKVAKLRKEQANA